MNKDKTQERKTPPEDSYMGSDVTKKQEEKLQEIWHTFARTGRKTVQLQRHPTDALLYDLALGELSPEEQEETRGHLADCDACIQRLVALQAAITTDREVRAVWAPKVLHAAGGVQFPSIIQDFTEDGKYRITLQPTREGQKDLLTLEVTSSCREKLEGQKVMLVSSKGTIILHGTISGGTVTRRVDRKLREEWPFRIHAG
ncbi:MAG: zf-HC2 domain-containing protein [Deltaproteobacteria bacterium]|nr:zf-HC2 domain-containing protein [Deltaproteobacteria bacterium]